MIGRDRQRQLRIALHKGTLVSWEWRQSAPNAANPLYQLPLIPSAEPLPCKSAGLSVGIKGEGKQGGWWVKVEKGVREINGNRKIR